MPIYCMSVRSRRAPQNGTRLCGAIHRPNQPRSLGDWQWARGNFVYHCRVRERSVAVGALTCRRLVPPVHGAAPHLSARQHLSDPVATIVNSVQSTALPVTDDAPAGTAPTTAAMKNPLQQASCRWFWNAEARVKQHSVKLLPPAS